MEKDERFSIAIKMKIVIFRYGWHPDLAIYEIIHKVFSIVPCVTFTITRRRKKTTTLE